MTYLLRPPTLTFLLRLKLDSLESWCRCNGKLIDLVVLHHLALAGFVLLPHHGYLSHQVDQLAAQVLVLQHVLLALLELLLLELVLKADLVELDQVGLQSLIQLQDGASVVQRPLVVHRGDLELKVGYDVADEVLDLLVRHVHALKHRVLLLLQPGVQFLLLAVSLGPLIDAGRLGSEQIVKSTDARNGSGAHLRTC